MKRNYTVNTEFGEVKVDTNDYTVFLHDGVPRNFFGEVIENPEPADFKHGIKKTMVGELTAAEVLRIEKMIQAEIEKIVAEVHEDVKKVAATG